MRRFLRLSAIVRSERNATISAAEQAMSSAGGWIVHFTLLSNAAATLMFEVPSDRVRELAAALAAIPLPLDAESRAQLAEWPDALGPGDVMGTLALTFLHGEPDLRREVPAFNL